jgi:uncharacterized protein YceK
MVPESAQTEIVKYVEGGYQIRPNPRISKIVERCAELNSAWYGDSPKLIDRHKAREQVEELWDCEAELGAEIRGLARLSLPDGSLLVDTYFLPFHFAAKLRAPRWLGDVVIRGDSDVRYGNFDRALHGMRHNSAIDFVASTPPSIAFVISSDGPVRAFTKLDDEVAVWPDLFGSIIL